MAASGIAQAQAQNSDGRAQLVWVDGRQARMIYEIDALGNWSTEADLGGHGYQLLDSRPMTMDLNKQGRLVVFAYAFLGGGRVALSQVTPNGVWGSWTPFP